MIAWFPYVLTTAVFLFAYSTMISWSYYGERCWEFLFGRRATLAFKLLFLACIFLGAVANLGSVLTFSDFMILCILPQHRRRRAPFRQSPPRVGRLLDSLQERRNDSR